MPAAKKPAAKKPAAKKPAAKKPAATNDLEALGKRVHDVLAKVMLEDRYYVTNEAGEEVPVVSLQHVATVGDGLEVLFMVEVEGTETDPEVVKLADGAMKALKKALPALAGVTITHKIWST